MKKFFVGLTAVMMSVSFSTVYAQRLPVSSKEPAKSSMNSTSMSADRSATVMASAPAPAQPATQTKPLARSGRTSVAYSNNQRNVRPAVRQEPMPRKAPMAHAPQVHYWKPAVPPMQCQTFTHGGVQYCHCDGVYYRPCNGGYVICRPPVGAIIPASSIAGMLRSLIIKGRSYYVCGEVIYQAHGMNFKVVGFQA